MMASSALVHHPPLVLGLDAHHVGVRHQRARAAAQHGAAARHVVELDEALRHQERVVVGQAGDARAEHDVLGALGRGADEDLRRGDDLPAGGVVLADPGLVVAELSSHWISSRSRSSASVGLSPTRWNGARKMPKRKPS